MILVAALLGLVVGLACGYALYPAVERRRNLRRVWAAVRQRRASLLPETPAEDGVPMPRDYYQADRRQRGTLSEDFGLRRRADDPQPAPRAEPDPAEVAMPRDYYERETPDDEGILSENFGLRRRTPPGDAA